MPFSKKYTFSEEEVLKCIAEVRRKKWPTELSANSRRRDDSLWYQVAVHLLRGAAHKIKTVENLTSRLYKQYMKDDMIKKWLHKDDKEDKSMDEDDVPLGEEVKNDEGGSFNTGHEECHSEPDSMENAPDSTPPNERFCICCEENDGSPYLQCDVCDKWYHFRCMGLSTSPSTKDHVKRSDFTCNRCLPTTFRGIINIGNSCWFASTIQAVKVTDAGQILKNTSRSNGPVADAIRQFLFELEQDRDQPINEDQVRHALMAIADEVQGPFANVASQQDASEFFSSCISNAIERKSVECKTTPTTTAYATEVVTCLKCGVQERRQQSFPMLTITTDSTKIEKNVSALFKDVVREDVRCDKCQLNQLKGYSYEINKLPPCLVLSVNRTRAGGRKSKIKISSFFSMKISDFDLNLTDKNYNDFHYKLVSAVVHQGVDCRSGHYYTYTFRGGRVVHHNDESIEDCYFEEAIADIAKNGIMLFYELSSKLSVHPGVPFMETDGQETRTYDGDSTSKSEERKRQSEEQTAPQEDLPDEQTTPQEDLPDEQTTPQEDLPEEQTTPQEDLPDEQRTPHEDLPDDADEFDGSIGPQKEYTNEPISLGTLSSLNTSRVYDKFFEAKIPRNASFTVDENDWKKLRSDQNGTRLPLQWVNVFYKGLRQSNPFCTLMFKRHRVSRKGSRKTSGDLFTAHAYCSRKPTCTVSATLAMGYNLKCRVCYSGRVKHKTDETSQRPVRADERKDLQDELWSSHCPSRVHTERLGKLDPHVLASGNLTGVGTDGSVFKQISYEGRRRLQSDKELLTSLLLKEQGNLKDYIRQISASPSYVVTFTDAGVRLFHELAKTVPLHWDATGSVAWKHGGKEYLYYAIIFPNPTRQEKGEKSSPCPIAELISTNQSEPTITNWLQLLRYREKRLYGHKNITTPCLISSDRSLPLLVSSLKVFSGETMKQYLQRSWRIVSGEASNADLNGMVIHSGLSHFMKDGKEYCRKYYKKENAWFGMSLFRLLAAVRLKQEFVQLLYSICIVLRAEHYSPLCRLHMKKLLNMIRQRESSDAELEENIDTQVEQDTKDEAKGEFSPPKKSSKARDTEEDALMQESSNFKSLGHSIDRDAKEALANEEMEKDYDKSKVNKYIGMQLLDRMLTYVLPTIPIWSNMILGDLTRHSSKYTNAKYDKTRYFIRNPPKTQGYMEAYNKIFKMTTVANFRFRLDELLEKMFTGVKAQQRKFVLQYKVQKKKKVGKKATTLVEEKWKKTSRKTSDDMKNRSSKSDIGKAKTKVKNLQEKMSTEGDNEPGETPHDSVNAAYKTTKKRKLNTLDETPRTSKLPKQSKKNSNKQQRSERKEKEERTKVPPLSRAAKRQHKSRKAETIVIDDENEYSGDEDGRDLYETLLHNSRTW
ncbi:Ubiquitin carboxyl-terminal hydrolase 36 [Holothuria leucospilota]|uniref:Ubiquitin carboxyl-terminal hydrolase 36 n=1 Tax=Holothuria leucospilota TaxID=206669 RepID=A0A9Q1BAH8_HOLLE|nr:Ubiquitin carboxyl-terminal hydrolase 36 [Holothuria leucospilota]